MDFDGLKKGDTVTVGTIQEITGKTYGTQEYAFAALALRDRIMYELRLRGLLVTVVCDGGSLRILTDVEASQYNSAQTHAYLHRAARSHHQLLEVDPTQLTPEERAEWERSVFVGGKYIQALAMARKEVKAVCYRRSVPGLPSGGMNTGVSDVSNDSSRDQGHRPTDPSQRPAGGPAVRMDTGNQENHQQEEEDGGGLGAAQLA
jgi:hypothetical protein